MSKSRYFEMMEQMGVEPKPEEIPPDASDFSMETLIAFDINSALRDIWDGMSGSYFGKDLSTLPVLFDIYGITDKYEKLLYMNLLNIMIVENTKIINAKIKQESNKHKRGAK